jgi:hypothetical protein
MKLTLRLNQIENLRGRNTKYERKKYKIGPSHITIKCNGNSIAESRQEKDAEWYQFMTASSKI